MQKSLMVAAVLANLALSCKHSSAGDESSAQAQRSGFGIRVEDTSQAVILSLAHDAKPEVTWGVRTSVDAASGDFMDLFQGGRLTNVGFKGGTINYTLESWRDIVAPPSSFWFKVIGLTDYNRPGNNAAIGRLHLLIPNDQRGKDCEQVIVAIAMIDLGDRPQDKRCVAASPTNQFIDQNTCVWFAGQTSAGKPVCFRSGN